MAVFASHKQCLRWLKVQVLQGEKSEDPDCLKTFKNKPGIVVEFSIIQTSEKRATAEKLVKSDKVSSSNDNSNKRVYQK